MSTNPPLGELDLPHLASLVSEKLREHGLDCVLVGGACVSIYSRNAYQSYDLDYATYSDMRNIESALKELGFKKRDKYFVHPDSLYLLDFVAPPIAIGNEPVTQFSTIETSIGQVTLLTPTDCVKDRLASFYHWDDRQAFHQALLVAKEHDIDFDEIRQWSLQEGHIDKFVQFENAISNKLDG